MKRSKKWLVVLFVLVFAFCATFAMAAGKQWFVIKDKKGVCKVIQAQDKTPKTIAGPFASKDAAQKAKADKCGPAKKKKK